MHVDDNVEIIGLCCGAGNFQRPHWVYCCVTASRVAYHLGGGTAGAADMLCMLLCAGA